MTSGIKKHSSRLQKTASASASPATAVARAGRRDAILNLTADGIIVIDGRGRIEAFNRGARISSAITKTKCSIAMVSLLMPSPQHEQHDGYLEHYLTAGEARIFTAFFTTKTRGSDLRRRGGCIKTEELNATRSPSVRRD